MNKFNSIISGNISTKNNSIKELGDPEVGKQSRYTSLN